MVVYLENKFIRFAVSPPSDMGQAALYDEPLTTAKMLQKLENYKGLYIISPSPEASHEEFCRLFRLVEAGGGVVRNLNGQILLIRRRGVWDLPKGWREQGESVPECALREVREECGLDNLKLGGFITSTEHIYPLNGEWILKRSAWYRMMLEANEQPVPQTEEEITQVRWFGVDEIEDVIRDSYATVREVIAKL